jgi:hypothetical protein
MVEVDSQTTHFLLLIKVCCNCLAYYLFHSVFQVIALFSANQRTHYRLSKCRYSRMSYRASNMQQCWVINTNFGNSYIRHIYVFNSESKPRMTHVMKMLRSISLPLSTSVLFHRNPTFMVYTRTWYWYVNTHAKYFSRLNPLSSSSARISNLCGSLHTKRCGALLR